MNTSDEINSLTHDLEEFIASQKEKIWNEKKKLNMCHLDFQKLSIRDDVNKNRIEGDHSDSDSNFDDSDVICKNDLGCGDNYIQDAANSSNSIFDRSDEFEKKNSMVRFGEFSPSNPNILSPGKTLLGLGEYEEKRKLILEKKKKEFWEQRAQARKKFQEELMENASKKLKYREKEENDTKQLKDDEVTEEFKFSRKRINSSTQTDPEDLERLISNHHRALSSPEPMMLHLPPVKVFAERDENKLSPRDRKLLELQESDGYSPSFLYGQNSQAIEIKKKQEKYQEELQKQIDEKKKIEEELREKEKREEEAIARMIEKQQERMKKEYEDEEIRKKELESEKVRQHEILLDRHKKFQHEAQLDKEEAFRRRKSKKDDNQSINSVIDNDLFLPQLEVSLPVPTLRNKEPDLTSARKEDERITVNIPVHNIPIPRTKEENHVSRISEEISQPIIEEESRVPTLSHVADLLINDLPRRGIFGNYVTTPDQLQKQNGVRVDPSKGVVTFSKPSPKGRVSPSVDKAGKIKYEKQIVPDYRLTRPELSDKNFRRNSDFLLDDSLPIPIFRDDTRNVSFPQGKSFVVESDISEAMKNTEAKWKVPAVQRTTIHADKPEVNQKHILTQLGAFRKQMQYEQLRMEEALQRRKSNKL